MAAREEARRQKEEAAAKAEEEESAVVPAVAKAMGQLNLNSYSPPTTARSTAARGSAATPATSARTCAGR
jgi:hypothetical protein